MKLFSLFFLLAATPAAAQLSSVFGPGEQTDYEVSYLGVTAGRARLTVGWPTEQFGHDVWPLVCVGESAFGSFFPIKDRFVSYWEPAGQRTLGADFFVNENKHRRRDRYVYDFDALEAHVTSQHEGAEPTERRVTIEQGAMDLAAAGFNLRNLALVPGEVHEFPIFTGRRQYRMKASVTGRQKLRTKLGELDVFRVTVTTDFSGSLKTRGPVTLFYTADEKQLPVRAEADFLLGTVRLDAVSYLAGRVTKEG